MDKIKKHNECHVPTETCNLRCKYCYIAQLNKFNNKIAEYGRTPDEIRGALSRERLGGSCMINFCAGGETLLSGEVVPIVTAFLEEGHYVSVVTNTTLTNRMKELCNLPIDLRSRLFIKSSFHYLELKRLGWLDRYVENINLLSQNGVSFTIEITPNDELIPYIDEVKEFSMKSFGVLPHVTIARDDNSKELNHLSALQWDEYYKTWSVFDSELFEFKSELLHVKRKEYCYAGIWAMHIDLVSGDVRPCYRMPVCDNIYKNKDRPIKSVPVGNCCPLPYCYNGHAFLAEGCIPECDTPTYASVRDRVDNKGRHWIRPEMFEFMSSKLVESNKEITDAEKKVRKHQA